MPTKFTPAFDGHRLSATEADNWLNRFFFLLFFHLFTPRPFLTLHLFTPLLPRRRHGLHLISPVEISPMSRRPQPRRVTTRNASSCSDRLTFSRASFDLRLRRSLIGTLGTAWIVRTRFWEWWGTKEGSPGEVC